jgi:hypothetical protein
MVQHRGRFCSFGRWRAKLSFRSPGLEHPAADHVRRVVEPRLGGPSTCRASPPSFLVLALVKYEPERFRRIPRTDRQPWPGRDVHYEAGISAIVDARNVLQDSGKAKRQERRSGRPRSAPTTASGPTADARPRKGRRLRGPARRLMLPGESSLALAARTDPQPERRAAAIRSDSMTENRMAPDQGRARGLYDEQLQRKQQEKALVRRLQSSGRPALFQQPEFRRPERPAAGES